MICQTKSFFYAKIKLGDNMNCKYCGAGLPSKGGVCPGCGRMIPIDQQKQMRQMLDPRLNEYRNKDTAMYKQETAYEDKKIGKIIVFFAAILLIILLIIIIKGSG